MLGLWIKIVFPKCISNTEIIQFKKQENFFFERSVETDLFRLVLNIIMTLSRESIVN